MQGLSEVLKIVEGGLQGNSEKVLRYSQLLVSKLEAEGDSTGANRLQRILSDVSDKTLRPKEFQFTNLNLPVDTESRLPLAESINLKPNEVFLVLPHDIQENITDYINLIQRADEFSKKGIIIPRSLLLYGPSGTGKTQTARYIAAQLQLPLITARIDGLISSYLGSTSKNLRKLFDFVQAVPCVLFLDEFDAIAKIRDDTLELGELKRVVNALLQNIDSLKGEVPIIAATNHEHLLDSAVWRRFDYRIHFGLPEENQRRIMIHHHLGAELKQDHGNILISLTQGMNGSEVERFCNLLKTEVALDKIGILNEHDLFKTFLKFQQTNRTHEQKLPLTNPIDFAKNLRESDPKTFTYMRMARMLGFSIGKAHKILKENKAGGITDGK